MAAQVDAPYISNYLSFPEPSINALLADPTVELVKSLLVQVALKAQEHEKLQADKLRLEVELENAVRAGDQKARVLKASVDRALREASELRQQIHSQESSRQALETELQALKSSSSNSGDEVSTLKARIAALESSNRDTLSLLQSKSVAYDDLASELTTKHQKTIELRSELAKSEQALQEAKNVATSAKFREQSMSQEVESLKRNNEWLNSELKTRSAEYTKFRKEKGAVIAELQRQNEDATSSIESLQRTEQTLRTRLDEVAQKADEYLAQIQEMQEEANRQEESFRAELETANRLAELMKESAATERQRHQELSSQLEQLKDDAADEVGRINAEIETEHQDRLAAEGRVAELEVHIERLEAEMSLMASTSKHQGGQTTPRGRGTPGPEGTPSRMMSPSVRGISYTQVITDYHLAKTELDAERRRNEKLTSTIDEMIREMEAKQPEIVELQADYARLEADVADMSNLVDKVGKERDEAKKEAKKWEREVHGLTSEGDLLRQQLRDLSSQIKVLLVELHAQGQGLDAFTPEQRVKLEQLARGEVDEESLQNGTDTDRFISQNLTTFRNISELTEQNMKLLRLTREIGDRLEGEEAQMQKSVASKNQEELEDLRQKYERCKDEIQSLVTQSQSYIRERDMFRRMLSHRGQLPPGSDMASMFGESTNGQPPATPNRNGIMNSVEQSPTSKDMADYAKLLKEMQNHFDSYRKEASADRSMLKEQLDAVQKKNAELRNEISKKTGEITLVSERYEMLQGNFNMLKSENSELQKRSQAFSDRAAKQDIRAQQIAEDLVEAKGLLESMRNETANLKAEKEFWKTVEKRLVDDNQSLLADRDRLSSLNGSLQQLLNDREHTDADGRRRLQVQVENLESDLQSTKRKLAEEIEEHKRAVMRREYENSQSQTRIDDLMKSLGSAREELAAAKTTRDHLQAKCDELTIELRSAEEKLEVFQQPQARAPATGDPTTQESSVSREQELSLEVSELKKDLDLVQGELANARVQVEQYKAISQSSEEELRSFNETQDQYRQEMEQIIEEKDRKIVALEEKVELLRNNFNKLSSELEEVRDEASQHDQKLQEQKSSYEAEIAKFKDLYERSEAASHFHQEDLKAQAEIAQQAQQNYENELLKHAEAAKTVQKVRAEYNELRLQVMQLQSTAEAAQAKLGQNEESWTEARERYEREILEIRSRRDDIASQNKILHQQLESVNKQIAELQSHRAANPGESEDAGAPINPDTENLQELIRYLRREKEIVDVQFDLSSQEARRLRQQLDHVQTQLEETRLKLVQQRHAEENQERHALSHKKLMDTIDELNLNRESNSALRLEKNQLQASLNDKIEQIESLQDRIQPLQAKVSELEGANEGLEQELRLAQEARARFEQRYLDLLNRSDSIDPAEFETLKQTVADLEAQRETLSQAKAELQAEVDSIPAKIKESVEDANKAFQETRQKLVDQSKNRDRQQTAKIRDKDAALQTANQEKENLQQQVEQIRQELEKARADHNAALERVQADARAQAQAQSQMQIDQITAAAGQGGSEEGQVDEESSARSSAEIQELRQKLEEAEAKLATAEARIAELESQLLSTQHTLAQAESAVNALQERLQGQGVALAAAQRANGGSEEIGVLHRELAEARQEAEQQRSKAMAYENAAKIESGGEVSIAEQINNQVEQIRAELTARHEERTRQVEETHKKNTERMKAALNKRLSDGRVEISQKLEQAHKDAIDRLKAEHEKEIQALNQRHQVEMDELRRMANNPESGNKMVPGQQPSNAERLDASIQTLDMMSQLTDAEIRILLQKNETARRLVTNSLQNRENKVREEQQRILAEKLAEAEAKANAAKAQAVDLEGKKLAVKLNMTENRAKAAGAKLEVVQKAAIETPEKPVGEVWAIAKDTRAAPNTAAVQRPASQSQVPVQAATSGQPGAPAQAPAQAPAPAQQPPQKPNPFANVVTNGAKAGLGLPSKIQAPGAGQPPAAFAQSMHAPPGALGQQFNAAAAVPNGATQPSAAAVAGAGVGSAANASAQPPQAAKPAARNPSLASALPLPSGAGRGSGIPRGGAGLARGGGGPRGGRGGSGAGRGGGAPPAVNTAIAQQQQQQQQQQQGGSPRNAQQLSAQAKQFVPKKRSAEETGLEGSVHAGDGKRARPGSAMGGGGGAGGGGVGGGGGGAPAAGGGS